MPEGDEQEIILAMTGEAYFLIGNLSKLNWGRANYHIPERK